VFDIDAQQTFTRGVRVAELARRATSNAVAVWDWFQVEATVAELSRVWLEPVDAGQARRSKQWRGMFQTHHSWCLSIEAKKRYK